MKMKVRLNEKSESAKRATVIALRRAADVLEESESVVRGGISIDTLGKGEISISSDLVVQHSGLYTNVSWRGGEI